MPLVERATSSDEIGYGASDPRTEAFRKLVHEGIIDAQEFDRAVMTARRDGRDLEQVLIDDWEISVDRLGDVLAAYYRCTYLPWRQGLVPERELLSRVKADYLKKHRWVPVRREGAVLHVVTDDPSNLDRVRDVRCVFSELRVLIAVGLRLDVSQWLDAATDTAPQKVVQAILGELAQEERTLQVDDADGPLHENASAIVRLTNQLLADAHAMGASDIHIEPYSARKDAVVRFRVDGACFTYTKVPAAYRRAVISRIKIMANLDIAESRKPQDGKLKLRLPNGGELECRVATLPTAGQNEDVVLRLLTAKGLRPLEEIDLSASLIESLGQMAARPHGILLCVGPTGSGKTTTLHALLSRINTDERKIWTVEDPVEITQDGLRQLQVHPKIGLTFATALRAFLRADPDVIMVGEMRDKETADIALEASLTGHLVLSTLHTNSAVETVTRLLDMGCDPFNFADALVGVLAKRLCRRLCNACKTSYVASQRECVELQALGAKVEQGAGVVGSELTLWRAVGCDACYGTGYSGRVALYELLPGTEEMKGLIQTCAKTPDLLRLAKQEGMVTLLQDGVSKVLQGLTTLAEVRKVACK
ncbi:MAG: GspE/PulE family protein [Nitrospiraceae bacterium]